MSITHALPFVCDGYVSVFSASRITGYSRRMVRHLIEIGELPASRDGKRRWKIKLTHLFSCLHQRMELDRLRADKVVSALLDSTAQSGLSYARSNSSLTHSRTSTIYSTGAQSNFKPKPGSSSIPQPSHGGQYEEIQEPTEVRQ